MREENRDGRRPEPRAAARPRAGYRASPDAPSSSRVAPPASAPASSLHFCDQGSRVAFVDVKSDLAQALIADIAAAAIPARGTANAICATSTHCAPPSPMPAANWGRSACSSTTRPTTTGMPSTTSRRRISTTASRSNLKQSAVRGAGRAPADARRRRRLDHQLQLDHLDRRRGDSVCYVTAKSAITGLTRALASELGPDNIRVNSITPGWIMTERQVRLWLTPEGERQIEGAPGAFRPPLSAGHRADGVVARGRRQPDVLEADVRRRRRLDLKESLRCA